MQVILRAKSNLVRVNVKENAHSSVREVAAEGDCTCVECKKQMKQGDRIMICDGKIYCCEACLQKGLRQDSKNNDKTWPKHYLCNFLEQGAVSYEDVKQGKALLKKETIDAMLPSFIGKPVIIDHRDVSPKDYKKVAVGYVTAAYFNPVTGWFDCEFILTDDKAKELVEQGYSVSCSFDVLETKEGGEWHAIKYDEEISKGEFQHLALVTSPRYEECRIQPLLNSTGTRRMMFNSKESKVIIKQEGAEMSKKNGLDIMSPLQRDKALESLSDSGLQALIDDPEEDKGIKELAEKHQAMRKQKKDEELIAAQRGAGAPGQKKNDKLVDAKDVMVKVGEEEISVEELINRNNSLSTENAALKAAVPAKENAKVCEKCNVCHEGECKPEDVAKKNEVAGAQAGDGKPKVDNEAEELKKKEEERIKAENKKNAQYFVKLNALKENAEELVTTMVDTLHGKLERGNSRYGSK